MTSQLGNRLWNRLFDGFLYNAQLEWHIGLFLNIKKTQAEAESFCGTLEGRLAVLDTDEKLNYVLGLSDYQAGRFIFVGATDEETERMFVWSNGANLTTNWYTNEPNRYRDENCVAIYHSAFIDISCAFLCNFACEIV
ncbi:C-type lectin domain family 4 member D-like [Mizuhopecten yessoensis]|uniref:C-type lectin domain family 4 member D-like n=1 Tax=Mizuhopecten yessoensis TaxID=6573 RepID=UPI000B45DCF9|nr:C-type lectin domain family 4 member D-like [Mizuhopecten yessoensis]